MTLEQFFEKLVENPFYILAYFTLIPITALIAGFLGKNEGHTAPWNYVYSTLVYLVCVPGIFAFTLIIYQLLFERSGIMQLSIYNQILPIISMIITLFLIRGNVSLDRVPGFGKLSGLMTMIIVLFAIMWILEKTRIVIFSYMPIGYFLLLLVALLLIFRYSWSKMIKP